MARLLLVALTLVCLGEIEAWDQPDFCQNKICPQFTVTETNEAFEERQYVGTVWISTKVDGASSSDIMSARSRLQNFRDTQIQAGVVISDNTWPALITVKQTVGGEVYYMSWFIPPDTQLINTDADPLVEVVTVPESTVYVRSFSDTPSIQVGKANADKLKEDLDKAGKSFDHSIYHGAGYDSFFSITHHNEIWYVKV